MMSVSIQSIRNISEDRQNGTDILRQLNLDGATAQPLCPEPDTIEATGIPREFIAELILKLLYQRGLLTGRQLADELCLHFSGVVDPILDYLKQKQFLKQEKMQN